MRALPSSPLSRGLSFIWLFLGVFEASEAVIQANCQVYYFIKIVRVCNHCYRALDLRFQTIEESRYSGPVVLDNPRAVFVKFN
jgi:hypothetical protein